MTEPTSPVISLRGLSKDFGGRRVVDRVSLEVAAGEVVGLLGPNGAGKTTTLRMLAGLLSPTEGQAFIGGLDVAVQPLDARKKLGFLTASTGLYDRLTVREVLTTFGRLHQMSDAALAARITALGQELDLTPRLDKRCGSLSSGERQRASIARAVLHQPAAYVLDEPTAALDPVASKGILDMVREAKRQGRAVLFSTHRMEEAEYLSDRLYFLREGRVVAEGTARELQRLSAQPSLTGAFLHFATQAPA